MTWTTPASAPRPLPTPGFISAHAALSTRSEKRSSVSAVTTRTLFQVLEDSASKYGRAIALHQPVQEGSRRKYQTYTWIEYRDAALEIAAGLRALGIQKGDIVALDSETRAEFYLA